MLQPTGAGAGSNKAQKDVVNKKKKSKKDDGDDDDDEVNPSFLSLCVTGPTWPRNSRIACASTMQGSLAQKQKMKEDAAKVKAMQDKLKKK